MDRMDVLDLNEWMGTKCGIEGGWTQLKDDDIRQKLLDGLYDDNDRIKNELTIYLDEEMDHEIRGQAFDNIAKELRGIPW